MTLKPHISNIVRVSSFHIWNISRIRKYLNQSAAEQIIHAFVTSRLGNGNNALLYGLPQNQISRLQHMQNTAARVVTLSRKSCHITPILKELHWLPVSQRIVFKRMLIVHKSVNNIASIYISELLKVYTPSRNLRSSNMSLLKEPGVIDLFLSRLWDSGIIFQLNSNLVIVKPDLSQCLKLILCPNFSKMIYICNCIVHVYRHIMLLFAIIVNCLYSCFFLFPRLEGGYVRATNLYYYYYYYYWGHDSYQIAMPVLMTLA